MHAGRGGRFSHIPTLNNSSAETQATRPNEYMGDLSLVKEESSSRWLGARAWCSREEMSVRDTAATIWQVICVIRRTRLFLRFIEII